MVRPAFLRGQGVTVKVGIRRCAVYTRKSSEEGLEQDFNSLHAQRDACEAFIRSQRGEGWRLVETGYDDGGLSGGTLERPALRQLFADIAQHRVDTVVVYKDPSAVAAALEQSGVAPETVPRFLVAAAQLRDDLNADTRRSEALARIVHRIELIAELGRGNQK